MASTDTHTQDIAKVELRFKTMAKHLLVLQSKHWIKSIATM